MTSGRGRIEDTAPSSKTAKRAARIVISPRAVRALLVTLAVIYLFSFAGGGLRAYFTGDDLMNAYQYWSRPAIQLIKEGVLFFPAEVSRPLGALFYSPLLTLFGLNPLPFRIVCMALLLVNLGLLYLFCLRLSRSREVAVLACVIGAYHAHLGDLHFNSGTIYDLLCFSLFYLLLIYYFRIRDEGAYPAFWQTVTLLALYVAALDAKEMAVALPAILAAYELVFHPPQRLRGWFVREGRFLLLTVPVTLAYILSRVTGPHRLVTNPAYYPNISFNAFMTGWKHYMYALFYAAIPFGRTHVVILWTALLLIALIARRRELIFAWLAIMIGVLPIIFIEPRGLYGIYMTLPAWYLFAAVSLTLLRDLLIRGSQAISTVFEVRTQQFVLFVAAVLLMFAIHRQQNPQTPVANTANDPVRLVYEQLVTRYPSMPPGASILFLSDPFEPYDYSLTFLFRLHYRDKELRVDRVKVLGAMPDAEALKSYLHVFDFTGSGVAVIR
jgi:hypothetical protein